MVAQISSIAIYVVALAVLILGILSFMALRRIRRNGKVSIARNKTEHEEMRHDFELGDKVLRLRIEILEDKKG